MEQTSAGVDTAGASVEDDSAPEWLTIVALVLVPSPRRRGCGTHRGSARSA